MADDTTGDFDDIDEPGAAQESAVEQTEPVSEVGGRRVTERLTRAVCSVKDESPSKFWLLAGVVVVAAMVLLVVVLVGSRRPQAPRLARPDFATNVGIDQDSSSRVQSFVTAQQRQHAELEAAFQRQVREYDSLRVANQRVVAELQASRQQAQEEALEARRLLEEARRELQAASTRQTPIVIGAAQQPTGDAPSDYQDFLRSLRESAAKGTLTPAEARPLLRRRLLAEGYEEAELPGVMDAVMERLGLLFVPQVAESSPRAEEIEALPEFLRNLFPEVRNYLYQLGHLEGKVLIRLDEVTRIVRSQAPPDEVTAEDIARLAMLARVRLAPVDAALESQLPRLVTLRDQRGIQADAMEAIEQLLWEQRQTLPGMSPGQHLALIGAVARARGAPGTSQVDRSRRPATAEDLESARLRVRRAIEGALAQGQRDQGPLLERARTALTRFTSDARITLSRAQQDQIVLIEVRNALMPSDGQRPVEPAVQVAAAAQPSAGAVTPPARPAGPVPQVRLGYLGMDVRQAGIAAGHLVPYVSIGMGLDPQDPAGAAAIVTMYAVAGNVGEEHAVAHLDRALGARHWADAVLRDLVEAGLDGMTFARSDLQLPGVPEEWHELVRAVLVADRLGRFHADGAKSLEALGVLRQSLSADRPILTAELVQALAMARQHGPWTLLSTIRKAVAPQAPWEVSRASAWAELSRSAIAERREAFAGLAAVPELGDVGDAVAHEIGESLVVLVPMVMAREDDGRISLTEMQSAIREHSARYASLTVAEAWLMQETTQRLVRPYMAQIGEDGGGLARVLAGVRTRVPLLVQEAWARQRPPTNDRQVVEVGLALAELVLPEVERQLVVEVLMSNLEPRLVRSGRALDEQVVAEAVAHVRLAAGRVAEPPYTVTRLNEWTMALHQEGSEVLSGRLMAQLEPAAARPPRPATGPHAEGPRMSFPPVTPVGATTRRQPIGIREERFRQRRVVLNAGTYANAYLTTGVSAEIGGEGNIPVLLEMPVTFQGPGGGMVHMPRVRIIGQANPRAGAERLSIQLVRMSYRFPNGRAIDKEINGYVADNIDGIEGAIGRFRLHAEKVLPAALGAGFLTGVGEALNQNATSIEVTSGGTTTVTETGSTLERALLGGASEGASIVGEYVRQYMADIRPTVSAPNGQPVTVILLDPVVFDEVTDEEWNSLRVEVHDAGF